MQPGQTVLLDYGTTMKGAHDDIEGAKPLHDGVARSNVLWNYGHTTVPRHYRDIFVSEYGIAATRISTIPYGEERPRVDGTGESIWAQNPRAEFAGTGGEITTIPPEVR